MAIYEQEQSSSCLLDELYCEEQNWEDDNEDDIEKDNEQSGSRITLLEQDMCYEEDELETLLSKENPRPTLLVKTSLNSERKRAVEWMLRVNSKYGFSALTSVLSVNYFDKCVSGIPFIQPSKPWTLQLAAVACLSLAAKVDETCVPFLLDLQVEGANPVFEPRDVQKMELLVLTTLEWKMHPITPLSFLDHIIRRLGLKHQLHWDFLNTSQFVLLSLLSDWRFVRYQPSVVATATMMHVIDQIEPCNALEYRTQLLNVLNFSEEKVKECYELIVEKSSGSTQNDNSNYKRKFEQLNHNNNNNTIIVPSSPSGVVDAYNNFSSDSSSNDSWTAGDGHIPPVSASASDSVSSSPVRKQGRVHEKPMPLQLPSMSKVFIDFVTSPR